MSSSFVIALQYFWGSPIFKLLSLNFEIEKNSGFLWSIYLSQNTVCCTYIRDARFLEGREILNINFWGCHWKSLTTPALCHTRLIFKSNYFCFWKNSLIILPSRKQFAMHARCWPLGFWAAFLSSWIQSCKRNLVLEKSKFFLNSLTARSLNLD